jgi:tetratricopeptide (TPR) repeat protein
MRQVRFALASGIVIAAFAAQGLVAFGHDSGGPGGMGGGTGGTGGTGGESNGPRSQVSAATAYFNQGEDFSKKKNWTLAIQAYVQAVRWDPKFAEAWNNLGSCYRKIKDYDKSFDAYKHALALKPDYPNAHEYMGRTYLATGNKDAAMREYEILKRLDAKMADDLLKAIQANDPDLGDTD